MPWAVEAEFKESVRLRALLAALSACGDDERLLRFLRDLLTPVELRKVSNRWAAACLLMGSLPEAAVAKRLKISGSTVNDAHQWVRAETYGTGAFREVYVEIHEALPAELRSD